MKYLSFGVSLGKIADETLSEPLRYYESMWVAIAAVIQAIATIVLVVITWNYARDTETLANVAKDQIKQSNDELEQLRAQVELDKERLQLEYEPNLVLNLKNTHKVTYPGGSYRHISRLWLTNLGRYSVHVNQIIGLVDDESEGQVYFLDAMNLATVLLTGETQFVHEVAFEDSNEPLLYFFNIANSEERILSANPVMVDIHFQYGSTANDVHVHRFQVQAEYVKDFGFNLRVGLLSKSRDEASVFTSLN